MDSFSWAHGRVECLPIAPAYYICVLHNDLGEEPAKNEAVLLSFMIVPCWEKWDHVSLIWILDFPKVLADKSLTKTILAFPLA